MRDGASPKPMARDRDRMKRVRRDRPSRVTIWMPLTTMLANRKAVTPPRTQFGMLHRAIRHTQPTDPVTWKSVPHGLGGWDASAAAAAERRREIRLAGSESVGGLT